jgi:exonuclease III
MGSAYRKSNHSGFISCILFLFLTPLLLNYTYYAGMFARVNEKAFARPLSLSCINCNSLNSSVTSRANQILKINGITKLGTDVIMLSDTRLSNKNLVSCEEEVKKLFLVNKFESYEALFNSSKNKRGVAILINKKINFTLQNIIADQEENFLLARLLVDGESIVLGSVYGPNSIDREFFHNLKTKLIEITDNNSIPAAVAGDWNCTYSADPAEANIDILNMRDLPNITHSRLLSDLCTELDMVDPYRLLHYNKIEFTYTPRSEAMTNKSRLDFFLTSSSLIDSIDSCNISEGLQNKLFDHKAVTLTLNRTRCKKIKRPFISNKVLSSEILELVVNSTVAETYVQHAENLNEYAKDSALRRIGHVKMLIANLGIDYRYRPGLNPSIEDIERREALLQQGRLAIELLNIPWLETIELNTGIDLFMEVLINNIRNEVTSFQSFFLKEKNQGIKDVISNLRELKANYRANTEIIKQLESELNDILDSDIRAELENYDWFEHISCEKMSPRFLNLAKTAKIQGSISNIRKEDGSNFSSDPERNSFVREYFSKIYRKDDLNVRPYEGCIEDFLGPEICNEEVVRKSKISVQLRDEMENHLSINELDMALEKMCDRSAGGPDGLSVKFVKKFWPIFRTPLTKYAAYCIDNGSLTATFLTASIRLIPKKGDQSAIKNWRPISLLNVLYKVISKALNNRLKKLSGTILTRSQKGFVDKRFIQECIINIVETINTGNKSSIPSFCLALDQAKAFDTVNHFFMREVYKFFGFGPQFIKMIDTLTTGRNASIILENGGLSEPFPLEGGHTQGNGPSPLLFDFGLQILIFKIEFCPLISSVTVTRIGMAAAGDRALPGEEHPREGAQLQADAGQQQQEVAAAQPEPGTLVIKDNKVEAFADDASVLAKAERAAVYAIKDILVQFYHISGLQCNFDKSTIMFFGFGNGELPDWAWDTGFKVVNSVKILGCEISNDLTDLEKINFEKTLIRIRNIKTFWSRFRLSLPGRISIAKCLMLPQVGYLGCILNPTKTQLECLKVLFSDFVKGNLNVGKDKVFLDVKFGGLGMIDIENYIQGLQCSWFKRLKNGCKDVYKETLINMGYGSLDGFQHGKLSREDSPVLGTIVSSFENFHLQFLKKDLNWKKSKVLYNPLIKMTPAVGSVLGPTFLRHNIPPINLDEFSYLTMNDIWADGRLKSLDEINNAVNFQLSLASYLRLSQATRYWDKKTLNANPSCKSSQSVSGFVNGFLKGSRQFRNIIASKRELSNHKIMIKVNNSFLEKCGLPVGQAPVPVPEAIPIPVLAEKTLSWWGNHFLSNRIRDFLFKYTHNLLSVNARLAHYNNAVNPDCTFCVKNGIFPVQRETFAHLFFECAFVSDLHNRISSIFWPELDLDPEPVNRLFWFTGTVQNEVNTGTFNLFIQITVGLIQFYIWECKLKKQLPSVNGVKTSTVETLSALLKISSKFKSSSYNVDVSIRRQLEY